MFEIIDGIRSILEACEVVRPNDKVLVIADNEGRSMWLGQLVMNVATKMGGEAVLTVINPPEMHGGLEPPDVVAAAMKNANVSIRVSNKASLVHSTARKEASAAGARYNPIDIPLEDIKNGASVKDLRLIKERTETLAQMLTEAKEARVTTPGGTDLKLRMDGRPGIPLHPLSPLVGGMPYYAESAVAPLEGSAEGKIVVDIAFIDWQYVLLEPLVFTIEKGNVVDVTGPKREVDRLNEAFKTYENSRNIGELGIGTSHTVPLPIFGTRRDAARIGTAHFAIGRNNDIGGNTFSDIHWDMLMKQAMVELDGRCVLKDGSLQL